MGIDVESTGNADSVTGSRLSGYGNIGMIDVEVAVNFDGAGNAENYNTGPFGFESRSQAAFAAVVEIGYGYHLTASAAAGKHTATPGTGKSRNNAFGQSGRMRGNLTLFGLSAGLCTERKTRTQER
jgi:hypothetical protein